jgi:serine protease Do
LEYWRDPNYGTADLSAGFWPDPFTVGVVSGGTVDVNALGLGGGCRGYATSAPDFRLNLSGNSSRIRIFFVADTPGDDATLIINDANANWRCNDDSSGTLNPMVEIMNPPNGQYDIWIGSYRSGEYIGGTLYITELTQDPSDYTGGGPQLPTATPTQQSPGPGLNYGLEPNFGTITLDTGFWPDPQEISVISGGTVDVYSFLGGSCRGYATSAPDVRLRLNSASSRLRIFFVASSPGDDATMIINDAYANWLCNDDSAGTLNPMIEIQNASAGQYDIWIGSYTSGEYIAGTLYFTEFDLDPGDY